MKKIILLCAILSLAILCLASCKQETPDTHVHSFGEWETRKPATCTTEGERSRYCSCGEKQTEVIYATGEHIEVVVPAVPPTCEGSGLTEGLKCKNCEEILRQQEKVDALGHNEVTDEAVPPTCFGTGLTEGKHCSVCNVVLVAQTETEKIAHTYTNDDDDSCNECGFVRVVGCDHSNVSVLPAVPPTCEGSGLTEGLKCKNCEEILRKQEKVDALGHNEVTDEAVPPTCTETGLTEGKHCSRCKEVFKEQRTVEATGHALSNGECENCDYTYSVGIKYASNGEGTCYVEKIGDCTDTDVVIPEFSPSGDRVTAIGSTAFAVCQSLTSVVIPDGVTSIGDNAFYLCTNLTYVSIPDSVTDIGEEAFRECKQLASVTIPHGVTSIKYNTFYECNSIKSIVIPDSVTDIGTCAFFGCTSLESLTIPESVTTIGRAAFYRCYELTSVTIPGGVTTIGSEAFCFCHNLTSVSISDSVTSIGKGAFANTGLTSVIIPDGVTSIGDEVFSGCYIEFVYLPDSLTSIGNNLFKHVFGLADVYYAGSEEQWEELTAGSNNSELKNVTIHFNSTYEQ